MWEVQEDSSAQPWPFPQTHFDLICFIFWLYKRLLWIFHQDGWMVTSLLIKLTGATGHFWALNFPRRNQFYSCTSRWRSVELPHPVTLKESFSTGIKAHFCPIILSHFSLTLLPCAQFNYTALAFGSQVCQVHCTPVLCTFSSSQHELSCPLPHH